jgi:hypothetical protein
MAILPLQSPMVAVYAFLIMVSWTHYTAHAQVVAPYMCPAVSIGSGFHAGPFIYRLTATPVNRNYPPPCHGLRCLNPWRDGSR